MGLRGRIGVLRRAAPDANGNSSAYVPPVRSTDGVMARPPVLTSPSRSDPRASGAGADDGAEFSRVAREAEMIRRVG